ncbi:MAG: hypothetical protein ACLFN4_04725 [Candidatus Acetothermia bacterium]
MLGRKKLLELSLVVGFFLLLKSQIAYAYIDPGIGSFFFQLLIAGLVGASFLIKVFWRQIRRFFLKYVLRRQVENENKDQDE